MSPLFALVNNLIECRSDAFKLITLFRRPVAQLSEGLGIWADILRAMVWAAVLTNALIIAFTSENVNQMVFYLLNFHEPQMPHTASNNTDFSPTYFTFLMSVLDTNLTKKAGDIITEDGCQSHTIADPMEYGGFSLQNTSTIINNRTVDYC